MLKSIKMYKSPLRNPTPWLRWCPSGTSDPPKCTIQDKHVQDPQDLGHCQFFPALPKDMIKMSKLPSRQKNTWPRRASCSPTCAAHSSTASPVRLPSSSKAGRNLEWLVPKNSQIMSNRMGNGGTLFTSTLLNTS